MKANPAERESKILAILADDTGISVAQISERLDVSSVTIRNDLRSLAGKGFVVRAKGCVFPSLHKSILDRQKQRVKEKTRIAKAAAAMINDGDGIMIVASTTSTQIVKYLIEKRDVHIVTNSTLVLPYARVNPSLSVTVVGGEFRASTESIVGPIALRELEYFHVKYAFIGCDGFSLENGATAELIDGAEVVKKMAEQAEEKILVVDSTKYGKAGFTYMMPLESMDMVITDDGLKDEDRAILEEQGLKIEVV
ncbi:MAG: DeoR/GlpR transcriptional regulator [Planctomycetes bacterium]|nr:DeoR/GlpR transcriptional regulator [Planctomycetota bacterium]